MKLRCKEFTFFQSQNNCERKTSKYHQKIHVLEKFFATSMTAMWMICVRWALKSESQPFSCRSAGDSVNRFIPNIFSISLKALQVRCPRGFAVHPGERAQVL